MDPVAEGMIFVAEPQAAALLGLGLLGLGVFGGAARSGAEPREALAG